MKIKTKYKKIIFMLILLLSIVGLTVSIYHIITWKKENDEVDETLKKINELVETTEIDDENAEYIEPDDDTIPKDNPFWQYIKMSLLNVNFGELKNVNPKVVGWIEVKGTNVNMPFVQTNNNSYYLNHSFDNTYNSAGWAFLDYRNNSEELDKNNIIYAHGRKNGSMFGSLRNLLKKDWLKDKNNYIIRISNEKENTMWQIFSVYHIPTTNDYIKVLFQTDDEFMTFADTIIKRSYHDFETKVSTNDKILTLSTCYSSTEKLVVHAKLIKKEAR